MAYHLPSSPSLTPAYTLDPRSLVKGQCVHGIIFERNWNVMHCSYNLRSAVARECSLNIRYTEDGNLRIEVGIIFCTAHRQGGAGLPNLSIKIEVSIVHVSWWGFIIVNFTSFVFNIKRMGHPYCPSKIVDWG
jgi:hypothetical protein